MKVCLRNLCLLIEKIKELLYEIFSYGLYFSLGLTVHWIFWGKPVWFTVTTFISLFLWPLIIIYELFWYILLTLVVIGIMILALMFFVEDVDDYDRGY